MNGRAFVIVGDRAAIVANDIDDLRYHAAEHHVPPGTEVPARSHPCTETQIMIVAGCLEFMVGGAATTLTAPDFARIPPGVHFAYRNGGSTSARLLIRSSRPRPKPRLVRASVEYAA